MEVTGRMPCTRGTLTRAQWLGFFALCLLSSSAWLVDARWPSDLPAAPRQGLHDLLIGLALGLVAWSKAARSEPRGRQRIKLAVASVLLLGVPATIAQAALSGVSEVSIAASFAMLPVAVVVLVSYVGRGNVEGQGTSELLAPAVIGFGGTLLLLPVEVPSASREVICEVAVVFAVLIAASASVWMYRLLGGFAVVEAAAVCCLVNAVFFLGVMLVSGLTGGAEGFGGWGGVWNWKGFAAEAGAALLFDLPQVVLLLWLMREVEPARFAARYLAIPLFTVIEGYVLLHPEVTLRAAVGAGLLVFGAWRLMTVNQHNEEPPRMLG
jgi:drug/metabolite transporter (DMT)-like permease